VVTVGDDPSPTMTLATIPSVQRCTRPAAARHDRAMTRPRTRGTLVDLDRYPLDRPGGPGWTATVARARAELADTGCTVLRGFVLPLAELRREGAALAPAAYRDVQTVTVYNTAPDPALPPEHPGSWTVERGNAFVPADRIPPDALIARLYHDGRFRHFLAECLGVREIHELADPLAGLCLNVVAPGREHPWHFDTNEFAVSLLTQAPEGGGVFEYHPGIRTPRDERFAEVRAALAGRPGRTLTLRVGDLQLFRGRYSLHRVTPVTGTRERHTAILSYSERPGVVGSAERTRQLFGRVLPAHRAADRARVDALLD
jgi:hypothetical protein